MMLFQLGSPQEGRAGEGSDEGHAGICGHGGCGPGRGGADFADEGKYPLVPDQSPGVGGGRFRFVGVIQGGQLQFPPVDAPAAVGFGECRLDSQAHIDSQILRPAAKSRRLAEEDSVGGDAGVCRGGLRHRRSRLRGGGGQRRCSGRIAPQNYGEDNQEGGGPPGSADPAERR